MEDTPAVAYDEQLGETFIQSFTRLAYNVTANPQTDTYGYGPAYLVNGLSNTGYWYQAGLSYDWPYVQGGYSAGFQLNYETFAPGDVSVYPSNGGGGAMHFSGPVEPGDTVLVGLNFTGGNVTMYAFDWNTSASAHASFSAEQATSFVGLNGVANSDGYFTGLMTEWYHVSDYASNEGEVVYSNPDVALSSTYVWADEFGTDGIISFLYASPPLTFYYPDDLLTISTNGLTAYADAYEFITGYPTVVLTSITLSPVGQSEPISPLNELMITYDLGGANTTTYYAGTPLQLSTDMGTHVWISPTSTSSSSTERWVFSTGVQNKVEVVAGSSVVLHYYDLVEENVSYSVLGGGQPSAPPPLRYVTAPPSLSPTGAVYTNTTTLGASPKTIWALRGSEYTTPQNLAGSSSTERWYDPSARYQGAFSSPSVLSSGYYHEFLLTELGPGLSSRWFNASSTAQLSVPGVYDRASGSGERVVSYSVDGGTPIAIEPTNGTVSISVRMNAPHALSINSLEQYQITVDPPLTSIVSYITPPTIGGDGYWYDEGTNVSLVLEGAWNRTAGTGERLAAYELNGATHVVTDTTGLVDALSSVPIHSPENVTGSIVEQYHLALDSAGSIAAITPPSVPGDSGWYDSGTSVEVRYNYTWNSTPGLSRENAVGYVVNGEATTLARMGSGTFVVSLLMGSPTVLSVSSVTQYAFGVDGGDDVALSAQSPTHDSFYDNGTFITATTACTWNVTNGDSREDLVSFALGASTTNVTRCVAGSLTTPAIPLNRPLTLTFNAVPQYLVVFQFRDSNGQRAISPSEVQLLLDGNSTVVDLPPSGLWLDSGTRLQLYDVAWEGADVKPLEQQTYTVDAPMNETVRDRVYNGELVATDYLGLPVSGARVAVMLVNGTTLNSVTGANGSVELNGIPVGNYTAVVSYLGISTSSRGDAAIGAPIRERLLLSVPMVSIAAVLLAIVLVASMLVARGREHKNRAQTPPRGSSIRGDPRTGGVAPKKTPAGFEASEEPRLYVVHAGSVGQP